MSTLLPVPLLKASSIFLTSPLEIELAELAVGKIPRSSQITISHIGSLYTEWDGSVPAQVFFEEGQYGIRTDFLKDRKLGLYVINEIRLNYDDGTFDNIIPVGFIVETLPPGSKIFSQAEVNAKFEEILRKREERGQIGLGNGPLEFQLVFFLSDVLITRPLELYDLKLIPVSPMGVGDISKVILEFLANNDIGISPNFVAET